MNVRWMTVLLAVSLGGGLSARGAEPSEEKQAADYSAKNGGRAVLVLIDG